MKIVFRVNSLPFKFIMMESDEFELIYLIIKADNGSLKIKITNFYSLHLEKEYIEKLMKYVCMEDLTEQQVLDIQNKLQKIYEIILESD